MLREVTVHADWCEMTMSMMREKQFEACERRLFDHPSVSLFSDRATDDDAQALYLHSYDHQSDDVLITLDELRARVLERLPLEARYLSTDEQQLLDRLLMNDGELVLGDWDNIGAAEALMSRLWCGLTVDGDLWTLHLPQRLHEPLLKAMNAKDADEIDKRLTHFDSTIHGLLYIAGLLHSSQPMLAFTQNVMMSSDALSTEIARRYLQASFEYVTDSRRDFILLHPGLADPFRLVGLQMPTGSFTLELAEDMILGGIRGILPEEEALHAAMCGALEGGLRPDYDVSECAEDLRMLAKQGVSYEQMESVMSSMLAVMPTERMKAALTGLYCGTPRWMSLKAAVAN